MTEYRMVDGSPRYHHKTTQLIEWTHDTAEPTLFIAAQHQLAHEVCHEHLGDTKYGVDADSVVWVQGKERSCPNCRHELDGSNWGKVDAKAKDAVEQFDVVKPEVFSEVCPYAATKAAAKYADWVVTVPQMIDRLDITYDDWNVIVDEESTQMSFFPKSAKMLEFNHQTSVLGGASVHVSEDILDGSSIDNIIDAVQAKIDTLERVPKRYRNVINAANELKDWRDALSEVIQHDSTEAFADSVLDFPFPNVEPEGSDREITKTFEYLRRNFGRYNVESALEAVLANPKIHVESSQEHWNAYLIPDTRADVMIQRELFENAKRVGVVGSMIAEYFLRHITDVNSIDVVDNDDVRTTNLDVIVVEGDEMQRRGAMTKISRQLTDAELHNLLICGSGTRAAQAHENIGPRSYFFRGEATLDEYSVPADGDWSVVSYMGSRLTRGVDVDTQVTIVRSAQFSSPRWHYYEDDFHEAIRDYENLIETHNAMLRGAAQGEKHIAVIPAISSMYFGLDQYVSAFDVDEVNDVVEYILETLDIISEDLYCEFCERMFVTQIGFREHTCGTGDSGD